MNEAAKRYMKQVERHLVCPQTERPALHARLARRVSGLLLNEPEAGYETLVEAFGPPETLAAELVADLDPQVMEQEQARRKKLRFSLVAAVVAVALCLAAFWYTRWTKAQEVLNGDFRVEEEVHTVTEEEAQEFWGATPTEARSGIYD